MMLLKVSFGLSKFNVMGLVGCPEENKPLAQMGYFYSSVYKFLEKVAKAIIADMQREEKAEQINPDVLVWHSFNLVSSQAKPGVRYSVTENSCTCPDHVYRRVECKHMKMFKSKLLPASSQPIVNLSERERLDQEAMQAREDLGL